VMRTLSAKSVLDLWEKGDTAHPIDRALLMVKALHPHLELEPLADLPIGQRDLLILQGRSACFGPLIEAKATCPHCSEAIEISFDPLSEASIPAPLQLTWDGASLSARLPTSRDMAALVMSGEEGEKAELFVLARCIGEEAIRALPAEAIPHLGSTILNADPFSLITLDLTCPACGHESERIFDPVSLFWRDIEREALQLLRNVGRLALAFGWSESDILSLSPQRRQHYLSMVTP
jgi:hypothetical protein